MAGLGQIVGKAFGIDRLVEDFFRDAIEHCGIARAQLLELNSHGTAVACSCMRRSGRQK